MIRAFAHVLPCSGLWSLEFNSSLCFYSMGLVESPDMFDRHSNLSLAMPRNDVLSWSSLRAPLLPRADWQTPPTGGENPKKLGLD